MRVYYISNGSIILNLSVLHPKDMVNDSCRNTNGFPAEILAHI